MSDFEEYEMIHEFMHPDESLKKWITAENYHNLYTTSWDWIMPVVEKIESGFENGQTFEVRLNIDNTKILDSEFLEIVNVDGNFRLNNTYKATVEFIKWYNKNK